MLWANWEFVVSETANPKVIDKPGDISRNINKRDPTGVAGAIRCQHHGIPNHCGIGDNGTIG